MICAPPANPCSNGLKPSGGGFDPASLEERLKVIETEISRPDAWEKPEDLTPLLREKSALGNEIERLARLKKSCEDMQEWLALAQDEDQSGDDGSGEALEPLAQQQKELAALLDETELVMLLSAEEDGKDAILEIHPGAGGTESQD